MPAVPVAGVVVVVPVVAVRPVVQVGYDDSGGCGRRVVDVTVVRVVDATAEAGDGSEDQGERTHRSPLLGETIPAFTLDNEPLARTLTSLPRAPWFSVLTTGAVPGKQLDQLCQHVPAKPRADLLAKRTRLGR